MEKEIGAFITYLHNVKNTSGNTEMSYRRDLEKVSHFMESRGICEAKNMKAQDLTDYVRFLEDSKFAAATVSRNIASLKAFYHYMVQEGLVEEDIADKLKAPKIEKKAPEIMSPDGAAFGTAFGEQSQRDPGQSDVRASLRHGNPRDRVNHAEPFRCEYADELYSLP